MKFNNSINMNVTVDIIMNYCILLNTVSEKYKWNFFLKIQKSFIYKNPCVCDRLKSIQILLKSIQQTHPFFKNKFNFQLNILFKPIYNYWNH